MKSAVAIVAAATLLLVGYCAGLLVEYQEMVRLGAYCRLYEGMFQHKQISDGACEIPLQRIEEELDGNVAYTGFHARVSDLPFLLWGVADKQWNKDWQDKAVAIVVGFHSDHPDVVFSDDVRRRLENFAPADEVVRMSIDTYAHYHPRKAAAQAKQQEEQAASRKLAAGKEIHADSFLGKKAPDIKVETWLTPEPETNGKFKLVDFWATWCSPCREAIPELNHLQEKLRNRLVVIGMGNEPMEKVAAMRSTKPTYALAFDSQDQMKRAVNVDGIPHVLLIDPAGVVRWEGFPFLKGHELTDEVIERVINDYHPNDAK